MKNKSRRAFRRRPIRPLRRPAAKYNNTSVNIQRIIEVPTGSSGKVFQVVQLLKDYFQDPKGIRIDAYLVKVNLVDSTQTFTTFQVLSVLDDENNSPTVMTNARPVNINGTSVHVRKPAQRRFYTISSNELTELVLHFTAPKSTTVFVDITTYFKIERDLIDAVPTESAIEHVGKAADNMSDFENLTIRSKTNESVKRLGSALTTPRRMH